MQAPACRICGKKEFGHTCGVPLRKVIKKAIPLQQKTVTLQEEPVPLPSGSITLRCDCGASVVQPSVGRKRKYCSMQCRVKAFRSRKRVG